MTRTQGSRLTAAGFAVILLAVSAGVGSGEYGELLGLVGVVVGANLVTLGVLYWTTDEEPTTTPVRSTAAFAGDGAITAFLRCNCNLAATAAAGMILASSAVTVVSGADASLELCCAMFALFLLGISLITIGFRGK